MPTKQPSFAERVKSMQTIANNLLATANLLTTFAQDIAAEADRMAAAAKRFSERRGEKHGTASPIRPAAVSVRSLLLSLPSVPHDDEPGVDTSGSCRTCGQPIDPFGEYELK